MYILLLPSYVICTKVHIININYLTLLILNIMCENRTKITPRVAYTSCDLPRQSV